MVLAHAFINSLTHYLWSGYRSSIPPSMEEFSNTEDLLRALASTTILPQLKSLSITTAWRPTNFWPLFCDIFEDTTGIPTRIHRRWRPLKDIHIAYIGHDWNPMHDDSILRRLRRIQQLPGMSMDVLDTNEDMFDSVARLCVFAKLPFGRVARFDILELPLWSEIIR